MEFRKISPNLAIKYLKGTGKAFVMTRLTTDDEFFVEIKKSSLIEILDKLSFGTMIEFAVDYDERNAAFMYFGV